MSVLACFACRILKTSLGGGLFAAAVSGFPSLSRPPPPGAFRFSPAAFSTPDPPPPPPPPEEPPPAAPPSSSGRFFAPAPRSRGPPRAPRG